MPLHFGLNTNHWEYLELLRGRDGRDGRDGLPGAADPQEDIGEKGLTGAQGRSGPLGPQGGGTGLAGPPGPRSGGVTYVRWGKHSCPSVAGTELVYAGRAGGTYFNKPGGGSNYLCLPDEPQYTLSRGGSRISGRGEHNHMRMRKILATPPKVDPPRPLIAAVA